MGHSVWPQTDSPFPGDSPARRLLRLPFGGDAGPKTPRGPQGRRAPDHRHPPRVGGRATTGRPPRPCVSAPCAPHPRASERVPSHPSGRMRQSSRKDASLPHSGLGPHLQPPVSLQQGAQWLLRSHLTFRSEYRGTNHSLRRTCSVQTAWVREHMLSPNQNT